MATFINGVVQGSGVNQATQTAIEGLTNEDTYIPPDLIQHHPGIAKAWASISADGTSILASHNIASFTDTATGNGLLLWDTDFSGTAYSVSGQISQGAVGGGDESVFMVNKMAAQVQILTYDGTVLTDMLKDFQAYGDQ